MQGSLFDAQLLMQSDLPTESRMPLNIAERKVRNVLMAPLQKNVMEPAMKADH